jgi:hypothetical protein
LKQEQLELEEKERQQRIQMRKQQTKELLKAPLPKPKLQIETQEPEDDRLRAIPAARQSVRNSTKSSTFQYKAPLTSKGMSKLNNFDDRFGDVFNGENRAKRTLKKKAQGEVIEDAGNEDEYDMEEESHMFSED